MLGELIITSTAAVRPFPSARLTSRWLTTGVEGQGEHRPDLVRGIRGKRVHDAVERLLGVVRVEGREDQVAGLGRVHRQLDRFPVAHLASRMMSGS
jgi:hypothetical protein